jgi:hypothetical protein
VRWCSAGLFRIVWVGLALPIPLDANTQHYKFAYRRFASFLFLFWERPTNRSPAALCWVFNVLFSFVFFRYVLLDSFGRVEGRFHHPRYIRELPGIFFFLSNAGDRNVLDTFSNSSGISHENRQHNDGKNLQRPHHIYLCTTWNCKDSLCSSEGIA